MILNNYWNWKAFINKQRLSTSGYAGANIGVINTSGTAISFLYSVNGNGYISNYGNALLNWTLKSGLSVVVGAGTIEPQGTDYTLESPISMSNISVTTDTSADGNTEKTVLTISGTNTTGNAVIIKEIGITKTAYANNNSGGTAHAILLLRELLANPINLENGQSFSLTIDWIEE